MVPRGRGTPREQRLTDAQKKLDAAEQELTDLDAAELIATRRYDVADGPVPHRFVLVLRSVDGSYGFRS